MSTRIAAYILVNNRNTVFSSADLVKRVWEHKNNVVTGFTQRYNVHNLVYYEACDSLE